MSQVSERNAAVLLAGGRAERMNRVDKLFAPLAGRPLLLHSLATLAAVPGLARIALVASAVNYERCRTLVHSHGWGERVTLVLGGARRQDSVWEGLQAVSGCELVVIHDGARPFVTAEIVLAGLDRAREVGAAVAAVPTVDTVKIVGPDNLVVRTPPRARLWAAQTPQVFRYPLIVEAYARAREQGLEATDDASLVEAAGQPVAVYPSSYRNLKVTTPEDLAAARALVDLREGEV